MDDSKIKWGRSKLGELYERWPKDGGGEPEKPVFLRRSLCVNLEDKLLVNMLEAYGIPCLCVAPGDGSFGRVVLGMSGCGMDIYVPESLYDDAVELTKEDHNEEL